jgi:SAM-dependent methyltransferase
VPDGIRDRYANDPRGASGFYERSGGSYANPHEKAVAVGIGLAHAAWPELWSPESSILDLCCGSGEVTAALVGLGIAASADRIVASDPYTGESFRARHGREVDATWSFADIAGGAVEGRAFDVVICSYALHLCEASWLPLVCVALARMTRTMLVVTPHKRPMLRPEWGLVLFGELHDRDTRVRVRRYDRPPS